MEYMNSIQMLWTLAAFIVFIGILIWAWSSKRDKEFDEAAHLIFDKTDDDELNHVNHQHKSGS